MRKVPRIPFITITLLFLVMIQPLQVLAQDLSTPNAENSVAEVVVSVRPEGTVDGTRFEAIAEPGETIEFSAVIENFGLEAIKLRTFVSDVLPTLNGGLSVADPDSERTGIATWVTYQTEEFTLQPGESILRPLIVQVPKGTPPGQYVNAVVLETVDPVQSQGMIRQFFRKIVTIYVTVPGDLVADFTLGEPEIVINSGRAGVLIPVENTGNVRLELEAEFLLKNPDGSTFYSSQDRLGIIYMGQSTFMLFGFVSVPPAGDYLFSITAMDRESQVQHSLTDVEVSAPEVEDSPAVQPVTFENVQIEANSDPIVFANVSVEMQPATDSFRSTRLTLSVYHNGDFVEDFVLAENLSIPVGSPTTVTQRYLPATNWESGTYTFSLKLESTDSGTTSLILEEEDVATLEVP